MGKKQGNYKELFMDIKQCQICGFSEAPGESKLHNICHNRYIKAKDIYGNNLLSYEQLLDVESSIKRLIANDNFASLCSDYSAYDYLLDNIYTINYTKSIKFWDYYKPHPQYEDFIALLWNTPSFIKYVSRFVDETFINEKVKEFKGNRKLKETDIFRNEFVFMNISEIEYTEEEIKQGVRDLSYLDNILNSDCDDEETDVEGEDEDIDETADFFKTLLTNIPK